MSVLARLLMSRNGCGRGRLGAPVNEGCRHEAASSCCMRQSKGVLATGTTAYR